MTTKNKSKPIVEKIILTESDKQEIDDIMNGRPTQKQISLWKERGLSINVNFNKGSMVGRFDMIRKRYYNNHVCQTCRELPSYKASYNMDGVTLVEYFCEKHIQQIPTERGKRNINKLRLPKHESEIGARKRNVYSRTCNPITL